MKKAAKLILILTIGLTGWAKVFPCGAEKARFSYKKEGDTNILYSSACFQAAPDKVWRALTDYNSHARFMPNTLSSRIISSGGNSFTVRKKLKVLWKEIEVRMKILVDQQSKKISWSQLEGMLKQNTGYWMVRPGDKSGTSKVWYHIKMEPDFYVPDWVIERLVQKNARKLMISVEKQAAGL